MPSLVLRLHDCTHRSVKRLQNPNMDSAANYPPLMGLGELLKPSHTRSFSDTDFAPATMGDLLRRTGLDPLQLQTALKTEGPLPGKPRKPTHPFRNFQILTLLKPISQTPSRKQESTRACFKRASEPSRRAVALLHRQRRQQRLNERPHRHLAR